jgi:formylglycine-generating enzyme required for sulfatase activity
VGWKVGCYPWGNFYYAERVIGEDDLRRETAPVGSRPDGASWVGAMDISGNVMGVDAHPL